MTKKVLIIGLNYSGALSGRINIAVNARGVFIADYGILEENITYLSDEWAPLTKAQIMTAIQTLVDESAVLDEIYVYYAGYGSGIRIVKTVDYGEVPVGLEPLSLDSVPLEPLDWVPPSEPLPLDSEHLDSEHLESEPLESVPLDSDLDSKLMEAKMIESKLWEAKMLEDKLLESVPPDDTITISIDELSNVELSNTELSNVAEPKIEPTVEVLETPNPIEPLPMDQEILPTPTGSEVQAIESEPIKYKYEFYPPNQSYDKLAKQMVASDYEIIDATEILGLLSNSRCRTICVLDMCPYANTSDPLMWGTDIIGNVNIISFAESDAVSSGKLATIQVITNHISGP
jgi:hypothetical protein